MSQRIMLVVPAESTREVLRVVLEKAGHCVTCCATAAQAERALPPTPSVEAAPDVIFVDAYLLEAWLEQLLARVRCEAVYARTLVVALVDFPTCCGEPREQYVEVEQPFHVRDIWRLVAAWEAEAQGCTASASLNDV